jgi:hypothetical protein
VRIGGDGRPKGGLSTGRARPEVRTGYPPAVRRERIWAGQQVTRLTVSLLVAAALATGCSNDEAPQASTELPSASSTSAKPTPELPPLGPTDFPVPDEARTHDEAGAEAFLRYWIDLLDHQRSIPDGHALRELGPDCHECLRIAHNYDEAAAKGIEYAGGDLTLEDVPPPVMTPDNAEISFGVSQEAVQRLNPDGKAVDAGQEAASNVFGGMNLTWSTDKQSWLVTSFGFG